MLTRNSLTHHTSSWRSLWASEFPTSASHAVDWWTFCGLLLRWGLFSRSQRLFEAGWGPLQALLYAPWAHSFWLGSPTAPDDSLIRRSGASVWPVWLQLLVRAPRRLSLYSDPSWVRTGLIVPWSGEAEMSWPSATAWSASLGAWACSCAAKQRSSAFFLLYRSLRLSFAKVSEESSRDSR